MKNIITLVSLFLFLAIPAMQAQSSFIKFDGVDGEAVDKTHQKWSEILAFSQAIHKPTGSATGATRRRGSVVLEDITVSKELDKSSPKLAEAVCKGKVFPKVEIHLVKSGTVYYAYELKNVMITSYNIAGDGNSASQVPMEEISLNFEEIKVSYTEMDRTGRAKGKVEYSWKVQEGRQ